MSELRIVADKNMRGLEILEAIGTVLPLEGRSICRADLRAADVLLVRSVTQVNASLLHDSPVRFVGTATSGFEHIDREYLRANDMGFCHAPGANANSVVEYVFAAICRCADFLEALLAGETLGIVGYGRVGRALAARCEALGISWLAYDPWLQADAIARRASFDEVLSCRVISVHSELTHSPPWPSFHLLEREALAKLRGDQLLINASRGGAISGVDLLERLRAADAPQVVLDVWENEPFPSAELAAEVALATAHIAGYSLDGKLLATEMLRDAILAHWQLPTSGEHLQRLAATTLRVPAGLRGAALLRWAFAARYDIGEDDRALRSALKLADFANSGFDSLRSHYRERRELLDSPVCIEAGQSSQVELLHALGCKVEQLQ